MHREDCLEESLYVFKSTFFNNGPIIGLILRNDENLSIEYISKNSENILRTTFKSFKDLISIDDFNEFKRLIHQYQDNTFNLKPFKVKDCNKNIWIQTNITTIYDENKNIINYIAYITDCSNQIKQEKELENYKSKVLESDQFWIDTIERNGDGYWEWDITSNLIYFSPQWKNYFGYDEEDKISNAEEWKNLLHPDDIDMVINEIYDYVRKKVNTYSSEHRIMCKDGSYKWILDKGSISQYDEFGNPLKMIGIYRDITYIKDRENNVKSILKNIPDLIWIKDIDGKFILCNNRFEQLYNDKEENIIGKSDYDYVSKELADSFKVHDLKALNSNGAMSYVEDVVFANDGHIETLYTTKTKLFKSDGSVLGILGISKDITELKKKEYEFEAIFNYSIDGLAILDLDGNFLDFNDSFLKILGKERKELENITCQSLAINEDYEKCLNAFDEIKTKGFIKNFEKKIMVNDKVTILNLSAVLLPDKKRILESVKDITDSKLLETQSKLASMGEMIGNIAHQWRQPLSVISTISSGVKLDNELNILNLSKLSSNMDNIVEQTVYLSHTIDDFRNFVKNDEHKKQFTIDDVLNRTLSILKASFKNNEIEVILRNLGDYKIYGYENEFIQALINILNNSKDALNEKDNLEKKVIIISSKMIDNKYTLEILDNAGGIKKEILNKVFEPYFTTKYKSSGTGLGLSITYKIFREHHNANILASNKSFEYNGVHYQGACFDIVFNKN